MKHMTMLPDGQGTSGEGAESKSKAGRWVLMVPLESISKMAGLSGNSLLTLMSLEHHCREKPDAYPSNRRLASLVGCSTRRITSALADLEAKGWIRLVFKGASKRRARIVMLKRIDPRLPVENADGQKCPSNRRTEVSNPRITGTAKQSEQARTRKYSAHAARCPRGRGRSTRSAADGPRAWEPKKMNAREMDEAILEYAAVAGTVPPRSAWHDDEKAAPAV